ncbi:YtxH domain-containing protein [Bacillus rubiinfantis]|uniref:YtxH domain-containing protein n=1 Tax=Bacillus rubiinfantis TaxID=1499680 RepID=UPI000AF67A05|nr:YtxH domain-containing protein [Bacillus rubiinfantis]
MMTKKNLFWTGMFLGAMAGGAISLIDKHTREEMKDNVQKVSGKVIETVRHPRETYTNVKAKIDQVREDFSFIAEKVEEIRELTPQVTEMIKETKESFSQNDELELIDDLTDNR